MGIDVVSDGPQDIDGALSLQIRLLGRMTIRRDSAVLPLPASRKVRALFAYLALTPHPPTRSQLCALLWDLPNDPRGELRWCLSKIRRFIDGPDRQRVATQGDVVRLDLSDCFVDAVVIEKATRAGFETIDPANLRTLADLFAGDFLDGLEIGHSPFFDGWLVAQRRRFRGCQAALLEHLVKTAPEDDALDYLERWLKLAPFDRRVHELLLEALARRGQLREAQEHLAATMRLFETEGLEGAPLRASWNVIKSQASGKAVRVAEEPARDQGQDDRQIATAASRRASVAVMPFADRSNLTGARGAVDGLAHDVITRLAKLRSLFVIAQGTVQTLYERNIGPEAAGRMLDVDYVVGGSWRSRGNRLTISVELIETRTARIVWADTFDQPLDDAFLVLDEIGDKIVASIASEIETVERNRAILKPPNSLDAWEAHHRGLWHMYRFNRIDNERAQHFFTLALRLDPTFSRAYSGLSFTHWQNAFQAWGKRDHETDLAYETAGKGLMADDRDPTAHWAMGRALWLQGRQDQSAAELEAALELSPNFALGHYALAFVRSQAGDARSAIECADLSRRLSPFDPLLFAMLGSRAMALLRLGRYDEAAEWGVKAAGRPNAHAHIFAIASYSLALAGRLEEARQHLAAIHKTLPLYRVEDLLNTMRFEEGTAETIRKAARSIGDG